MNNKMTINIKCAVVARMSDNSLLFFKVFGNQSEAILNSETKLLLSRIQSRDKAPEERDKISTSNGLWSYIIDKNQIAYIILTNDEYPERHAFDLIHQIKGELQKLPTYNQMTSENINKHLKKFVSTLAAKYEDLQNFDKIYQAQTNVEQVQLMMEDNMKKMLNNQVNIQGLDKNSNDMRMKAEQFHKSSTSLARMMYWRNMKLKIIIAIIVIAILLYIIVPIIISQSNK